MNLLEMSYDDINSMRKKTLWSKLRKFWKSCQRSLWFLRFLTCVSWGVSSAQILLIVQTTAIRHSIFYFSSFSMFLRVFFFALYLFHPILFYSSFYSLLCFLPLFIHFIFWSPLLFSFQICYLFFSLFLLLCSVSSLLCSITIQSVLFLLVFIFSDPSI